MRESLYNRLLTWYADSSPRVQYPAPRRHAALPGRFSWKYPMPLEVRIGIALLSFAGILIFGGVLIALFVSVWAALSN